MVIILTAQHHCRQKGDICKNFNRFIFRRDSETTTLHICPLPKDNVPPRHNLKFYHIGSTLADAHLVVITYPTSLQESGGRNDF